MTPRVTVLLAVKDGLPWVRETVESVLAQTYRDFELLIVDDGSSDGTAEAAKSYGDGRIRVLRNERNLGQVPSLNLGLDSARGEIVSRIDADDRMLPNCLARQVEALDADPTVTLVGTWVDVVDTDGRPWAKLRGHVRTFPEFVLAILADCYPFAHPSIAYRRDVVRELGAYDVSLAPAEDKDLYRRLALSRHEARGIEEALVLYRRHERQLSQEHHALQLAHDHAGQEWFLAELGATHPHPLRLLLAGDAEAWHLDVDWPHALAELLAGARRKLELSPTEALEIERLFSGYLARVATAAWRTTSIRRSAPIFVFAARKGAGKRTPLYAVSACLGPSIRPLLALTRRGAASSSRFRVTARRSRLLRALYAKLPR